MLNVFDYLHKDFLLYHINLKHLIFVDLLMVNLLNHLIEINHYRKNVHHEFLLNHLLLMMMNYFLNQYIQFQHYLMLMLMLLMFDQVHQIVELLLMKLIFSYLIVLQVDEVEQVICQDHLLKIKIN